MDSASRLALALLLVALVSAQGLLASVAAAQEQVELRFYPEQPRGDYFEVGFSVSLTGDLASYGGEALCALKATVDWINDRGGVFVKGIRYYVRLVYADDGSDPERAVAVYEALYKRGVRLFLSPQDPVLAQAVSKGFMGRGDVEAFMANYALGSEIMVTDAREKIVGATGTLTNYILEAFKVINGLEPAARVFIIHSREQVYSIAVSEAVDQAEEKKVGVIVIDTVSLGRETLNFDITRAINLVTEEKPDIVVIVASDKLAGEIVKRLYGKIPVKLVVTVGLSSPRIFSFAAGPTQSQDVLVVTDWLVEGAFKPEEAANLGLPFAGPTFEVFKQYMKERCPAVEPQAVAARAAAALTLLTSSVQRANSFDPAKVRQAAVTYGITTFYGLIVVDEYTSLSKMPPITVGQWDAGKLKYLGHVAYEKYQHAEEHTPLKLSDIRYPSKQWREALEQGATGVPQQPGTQEAQQGQGQPGGQQGGGNTMLLAAAAVVVIALAAAGAFLALRRRG